MCAGRHKGGASPEIYCRANALGLTVTQSILARRRRRDSVAALSPLSAYCPKGPLLARSAKFANVRSWPTKRGIGRPVSTRCSLSRNPKADIAHAKQIVPLVLHSSAEHLRAAIVGIGDEVIVLELEPVLAAKG